MFVLPDEVQVLEVQAEGLPAGGEHREHGGGGQGDDRFAEEVQDQVQGKHVTW